MTPRRPTEGLGNAIGAMVSRVGGAGAIAVSSALLARRLGPDDFGLLAVLTSLATAGSFAASAGLNRLLLRDTARNLAAQQTQRVRGDAATAWRILAVSMPLGALVTFVLAGPLTSGEAPYIVALLAGAAAIAMAVLLVQSDLLRGLGELTVANLTTGRSGGALGLGLLCIALLVWPATAQLEVATLAYVLALVAAGTVGAVRLRQRMRLLPHPEGAPVDGTYPSSRVMARAGLPFAATQLSALLASQVDLWVAGIALPASEVGAYGAALRLTTLIALPLQAAQLSLVTKIAALHLANDHEQLQRRVRRAAFVSGAPAFVALLACVAVPELLLTVVFGPGYDVAAPVLQLLAVGQAVNVASGLAGIVLSMSGNERVVLVVTMLGGIGTVVLGAVGAATGGLVGLALGSAASTAAMWAGLWWLAHAKVGVWTHPGLQRISTTNQRA